MNIIKSTDYKQIIADFEVLIDPASKQPAIGLKVDPTKDRPFIMPMSYTTARELAETILRTLIHAAPDMFAGHAND